MDDERGMMDEVILFEWLTAQSLVLTASSNFSL